jgi:hypothetical protein
VDAGKGAFCRLAVYSSQPGASDAARDFVRAWKEIFPSTTAPNTASGRTGSGLNYLAGGTTIAQAGKAYNANLFVFGGAPKLMSILVIVSSQSALNAYRSPIESFLQSFRLSNGASAGAADRPAATDVGAFRAEGLSGVWMGFKTFIGSYEPRPRWITFFDDGQVFEDIPLTGWHGFDRTASKADADQKSYWGTYRYGDGSGIIEKPGAQYRTRIQAEKPGQIKLDMFSYYRCANVDGLRLEGAWTSYSDPQMARSPGKPGEARPIFHFTRDGRFRDEGVFATFLKNYRDQSQGGAGSGTYDIKDFTLSLRYSDGRSRKVAITGFLSADPASTNDTLCISRAVFRKVN